MRGRMIASEGITTSSVVVSCSGRAAIPRRGFSLSPFYQIGYCAALPLAAGCGTDGGP